MLAVLDPLLFGGSRAITEPEIDEVVRVLRHTSARIPNSFYWRKLELDLIRRRGSLHDPLL